MTTIEPHEHWCKDGPTCGKEILFQVGWKYRVRGWFVAVDGERRSEDFRNRELAVEYAKKRGWEIE